MRRLCALSLMIAALTVGCGGKGVSPTAPTSAGPATAPGGSSSGPGVPANPLGATLTGTVNIPAATIAVMGTALSATADGGGHFSLSNVPAGDVHLQVSAAGANATVTVANVQPAETVDVDVVVNGSSAALESEVHDNAGQAELEGHVEDLPPTTPAGSFKAAGRLVKTNVSTQFVDSGRAKSFADLTRGMHVHVRGTISGDTLTATVVEMQTPENDDHPAPPAPTPTPPAPKPPTSPEPNPEPEAELKGAVSNLTGSGSSFQFNVGSVLIKGDGTTIFVGSSNTAKTFGDLKNGVSVEVDGVQKSGFVQATRIHIENEQEAPEPKPEPQPEPENEVEVQGTLGAIQGTCPAISSSVSNTKFTTSASTNFEGAACTALKSGDSVEVKGTKKADGTVAATRVALKK
jgi:uncharacterized protein DUF5666/carboxypeptidase-like protein